MMESLSFGLMGLSVLVAVVSFVSAHKGPLPDFSKMGCSFALLILTVGFLAGVYSPFTQYRGCSSACDAASNGESATFESEVDYARVQSELEISCIKGAKAAEDKSRLIADKENDPSLFQPINMKEARARCKTISLDRCTSACYTGDAEG